MKKQFLSAVLLLTVSVGAAFALQTKTSGKLTPITYYEDTTGCPAVTCDVNGNQDCRLSFDLWTDPGCNGTLITTSTLKRP